MCQRSRSRDNTSGRHLLENMFFLLPTSRWHKILHSQGLRIKSPSPFQEWNPLRKIPARPSLNLCQNACSDREFPAHKTPFSVQNYKRWAGFQVTSVSPSSQSTKPAPLSSLHSTDRKLTVRERKQLPKVTQAVSYDQIFDAT